MSSTQNETSIYQLKISISESRPPIWRRVLIHSSITLAEMHPIIQALMGWYDDHLHMFELPGPGEKNLKTQRSRRTSRRLVSTTDPAGQPFDWMDDGLEDESKAILAHVAPVEKAHFLYIYDMGDNWEHDILVEKILPADSQGVFPICLAGKRNGPIEDCGGIWGYEEMLEVLNDSSHEEHRDIKEWLKAVYGVSTWDGDAFDQEDINKKLKKLRPKTKRASRTS